MPKNTLLPSQPKGVYRVKNWPEYNAGLIVRGNVTLWIDEGMWLFVIPCGIFRGKYALVGAYERYLTG